MNKQIDDFVDLLFNFDMKELEDETKFLENYKKLQQENKALNDRIAKAIEYIEKYDVLKEYSFPLMKRDEENQIKSSIKYEFDTSIKKELLKILKGELE